MTEVMFKPVDSRQSFPKLEEEVLELWKANDTFRKSVDERPEDKLFVFYEGPPTANNRPGVHHVLARAFKDLFPRYKTMRGHRVPRKGGWDTHGLPVELEVERELGLKTKPEIEEFGVEEFNKRCRESVFRYVQEWEKLPDRDVGGHARPVPHVRQRLHRERVVDRAAAVGARLAVPGLPLDAALPALRDVAFGRGGGAGVQGGHAGPERIREVPADG
jgi:hypothetical protein